MIVAMLSTTKERSYWRRLSSRRDQPRVMLLFAGLFTLVAFGYGTITLFLYRSIDGMGNNGFHDLIGISFMQQESSPILSRTDHDEEYDGVLPYINDRNQNTDDVNESLLRHNPQRHAINDDANNIKDQLLQLSCSVDEAIRNSGERSLRPRKLILVFASKRTGSNLLGTLFENALREDVVLSSETLWMDAGHEAPRFKIEPAIHRMAQICSFPLAVVQAVQKKLRQVNDNHNDNQERQRNTTRRARFLKPLDKDNNEPEILLTREQRVEWERQFWNSTPVPFPCSKNISDAFETTSSSLFQTPWSRKFISILCNGRKNPEEVLSFLRLIPSVSTPSDDDNDGVGDGYVYLKVFPQHLKGLNQTVAEFLHMVYRVWPNGEQDVSVFVLWRRNILESYVSHTIAMKRGGTSHVNMSTDESNAVTLDCKDLKGYASYTIQGYQQIYDGLREFSQQQKQQQSTYQVIEYNRDLLSPSKQRQTMARLISSVVGGSLSSSSIAADSSSGVTFVKQSQVSVDKQVTNWEEVQSSWGDLGKEVPDWDELFGFDRDIQHDEEEFGKAHSTALPNSVRYRREGFVCPPSP